MGWVYRSITIFALYCLSPGSALGYSKYEIHDLTNDAVIVYEQRYEETTHPLSRYSEFNLEYPVIVEVNGKPVPQKVNEWLKNQVVLETKSHTFKKKFLAATQEAIQEELWFQPIHVAVDHLTPGITEEYIDSAYNYAPLLYSIESHLIGFFDDVVMVRVDLLYRAGEIDGRRWLDGNFSYNHVAYINVKNGKTFGRNSAIDPNKSDQFVDYFMRNVPLSPKKSRFTRTEVANGYGYWDGSAVRYTVQGSFRGTGVEESGELPVQMRIPLDSIRPFLNNKGPLAGLKGLKLPATKATNREQKMFWKGYNAIPYGHRKWMYIHPQETDMTGIRELKIHKDSLLRFRFTYDREGRIHSRTIYWDEDKFDSTTVCYAGESIAEIHCIDSDSMRESWHYDDRGNLTYITEDQHPKHPKKDSLLKSYRYYDNIDNHTYKHTCYGSKYYAYCKTYSERITYKDGRRVAEFHPHGSTPRYFFMHYDDKGRFISMSSKRDGDIVQGVSIYYNSSDQPVRIQWNGQAATQIDYEDNRITKITTPGSNNNQEVYTFKFDKNGLVIEARKTDKQMGRLERVNNFRYEYSMWD